MATAPTVHAILDAGGPHLAPLMDRLELRLAELARGHGAALGAFAGTTVAAGGKRLRPLLVFVCAGADAESDDGLVRAAAAVELVHSATLVHDDVLDAASLRRGVPTVVATGGRAAATATGDLLFSRAFAELAANDSEEQIRTLSNASSALARGELRQREDAFDVDVPVERYLERCELKTASLFAAACVLGALHSPTGRRHAEALGGFGRRIGVGFQLLDDVLDVSGPPERTGKPRGTDLLDGTVTLPLILARARDETLGGLDVRSVASAEDAAAVCDRIAATGALEDTRARALELVDEAKGALPSLPGAQRTALELVADGVVERFA